MHQLVVAGPRQRAHQPGEDEDEQVDGGKDCVLVAAEEQTLASEVTQEVICVQQPQAPQDPQEGEVLCDERRKQQRHHDDQIRKCIDARKLSAQVLRYPQPGGEINEDQYPEQGVQRGDTRRCGQCRSHNEIGNGQRVEDDQPIAKQPGALALASVEQSDRSVRFFH